VNDDFATCRSQLLIPRRKGMRSNGCAMDCLPHIHVAAIHADHGYRSFTPGIGAMCRGKYLLGAGVYKNSLGNGSAYAAAGWQPWTLWGVKIGGLAGVVSGYEEDRVVPLAALFVSYKHLHFSFIPEVKTKTPAVMGFSFTFPLK